MSEQSRPGRRRSAEAVVKPTRDTLEVEQRAEEAAQTSGGGILSGSVGHNLGLVVALGLICLVGVITTGDRFASIDNAQTILRLASTIGVVSVGMTFVIIGG